MTDEEAQRRLAVGVRIHRHGYVVGGAMPHLVSVDDLEQFADELDAKCPEKAWNPVTGPWGRDV